MLQLSWRNWPYAHGGETAGRGMSLLFKHAGLHGSAVPQSSQSVLVSMKLLLLSGWTSRYFLFFQTSFYQGQISRGVFPSFFTPSIF